MTLKAHILAVTLCALVTPAVAQIDTQGLTGQALIDHVVQEVVADGYTSVRVKRKLFGEVRVRGIGADQAREVAIFPRSGRLKWDQVFAWPVQTPVWDPSQGPDFADIEGQMTH
ncbi:MAG: hypothetical protein GY883_14665 [Shimia sp.]|nr:hypothetical protein [Shimia sp.]